MALRIFKMIATSGFLAALECTEFVFGRGSAPDQLKTPPNLVAGLRSFTSHGEDRRGRGERERKGERKGTGGTAPPFSQIHGFAPVLGAFKESIPAGYS